MTLVITVIGNESIWMSTDRRLTYKGGKRKDDARKLMFLETIDGHGIVGYAGLGATVHGTEPSDWMACVLRGRNVPFVTALSFLADVAKTQLPQHLRKMLVSDVSPHSVIIPAFVNSEPRLYSIDLVVPRTGSNYFFRFTRYLPGGERHAKPPRVGFGGRGCT